jgi:hypothetical protein
MGNGNKYRILRYLPNKKIIHPDHLSINVGNGVVRNVRTSQYLCHTKLVYNATRNIHYFWQTTKANNLHGTIYLNGPKKAHGRQARKTFTVTHTLHNIPFTAYSYYWKMRPHNKRPTQNRETKLLKITTYITPPHHEQISPYCSSPKFYAHYKDVLVQ